VDFLNVLLLNKVQGKFIARHPEEQLQHFFAAAGRIECGHIGNQNYLQIDYTNNYDNLMHMGILPGGSS
jgi:hypothetical protein